MSNLSSRRESSWTDVAVRAGILRNYVDPQAAVSMEGTAICKRIGKCDMFHVALFVPTLKVAETLLLRFSYDLEVSLLWQRSESRKLCSYTNHFCLYRWISKFDNFIFLVHLTLISPSRWWRNSPTKCGPGNYLAARSPCNSVPDRLPFMLVYCVLLYLLDFFNLQKNSHIVTVWNLASRLL